VALFGLALSGVKKEFLTMTSTVTSKGQTVVPKKLRERLKIGPGTTLDWQEDGRALRVVKLERAHTKSFIEGLRQLGSVPAAARDKRPVEKPR
jgi:AbrB family looped-hinge helix DNA binding protein